MGTNFSNLQVFCADADPAVIREQLISAIRGQLLAAGYEEVAADAGDDQVHRTLVVGPAATEPWIALYDDEDVDALAGQLSGAMGRPLLGIAIADSDALYLSYFENGSCQEVLDSSKRPRKRLDKWARFLAASARAEEFRTAFYAKNLFADDNLLAVAPMLSLNPAYCSVGMSYLHDVQRLGLTPLRFRMAHAAPEQKGETRFDLLSWELRWNGKKGETKEIRTTITNLGAASVGLQIIVWGPAVDDQRIWADSVQVWDHGQNETVAPVLVAGQENHKVWVATFPNRSVPDGFDSAAPANARLPVQKFLDRQYAAALSTRISLKALASGSAEAWIGFIPMANRDGWKTYSLPINLDD